MKKGKQNLKNKDAVEFVLVNRGMDDPNYNNPNVPSKVFLHVPKEEIISQDHEKIIQQIPEISRGVYSEKAVTNTLKELGIENLHGDMDYSELKRRVDDINKRELVGEVAEEEVVDTTFRNKPKVKVAEDTIDDIFTRAKVTAEITEYNKFGLKKDIDPEVLNYITDKAFVEGVDIFIPAPQGTLIDANRFDIDIPLEKMNEDYKEVYEALQDEDQAEELEDDFVLLANEGVLPISIEGKEALIMEEADEMVLTETKDRINNPSYKFITKEEKEMIDRMEEKRREAKMSKQTDYEDEEEEYEDYEYDEEDELMEEIEEVVTKGNYNNKSNENNKLTKKSLDANKNDEQINENMNESQSQSESEEEKVEYFENNFKIEYEDKKQNKKGKNHTKKKVNTETFTITDLNTLIHDENFVSKTIELFDNRVEDPELDNEGLPVYYPKKRLDITAVHGRVCYLPKTIGAEANKTNLDSTIRREEYISKMKEEDKAKVVINTNKVLISTKDEETKEEKKLRKKLVKEEKKEKRKQKKDLKEAFQTQKTKMMKQIANTNQVIRYGLSVKEI